MGLIQQPSWFEDFVVGQSGVSSSRTITETDIVAFAGLSGDYNEIHVSQQYAEQKSMFGKRIAHGLLGLSVASGLAVQMGFMRDSIEVFRAVDWEFLRPIFIGDTVHLEVEIGELKAIPRLKNGKVTFLLRLKNQQDEVVQQGKWHMLVKFKERANI